MAARAFAPSAGGGAHRGHGDIGGDDRSAAACSGRSRRQPVSPAAPCPRAVSAARPRRPRRGLWVPLLCAALGRASAAAVPSRRITAIDVTFQVPAVVGTSIPASPNATIGANGVDVYAGVTYSRFDILASANLGINTGTIRVKLVVFDIRATQKECPDIDPFDWMGPPFDGRAIDLAKWANPIPETDINSFAGVRFPRAGKYRLCYTDGTAGSDWYLLGDEAGPGIFVLGALSQYKAEEKVWCALSPMQAVYKAEFLCLGNPKLKGCECMGKIEGRKRRSVSPFDYMALGLPDPAMPAWRVWVTDMNKACGVGGAPEPNPLEIGAPAYAGYEPVFNYQGYEVHNFGRVYNPDVTKTSFDGAIGTWRLCYCTGLAMDGIPPACAPTQQGDYVQPLGRLIILTVVTTDYSMAVYPTLRFDLYICCGSQQCVGQTKGYGGCNEQVGEPRYKIVSNSPKNDYLYFESESGCRTAKQVTSYSSGAKVFGGHLNPVNCRDIADCYHIPYKPESCSAGVPCVEQRQKPTFQSVQIDASYDNSVMVSEEYDVCYCDGDCSDPINWLKAGAIRVRPMILEFQSMAVPPGPVPQIELTYPSTGSRLLIGSVVVNTPVWIVVMGSDNFGSWSSPASPNPSTSREMKILRDECGRPDRPCEMKRKCLSEPQPNIVSGHRLVSGNTDYTDPVTLIDASLPRGQRWGSKCAAPVGTNPPLCQPGIEISEPGWYAVCYCDTNCNEMANWLVVGRQFVVGPIAGQTWRRYTETSFSLSVEGWGLTGLNKLRLLSPNDDLSFCGTTDPLTGLEYAQTDRAFGPEPVGAVWNKARADASNIMELVWDPQGTKITFNKPHGLKDGDYIVLSGITVQAISTDPVDVERAGKQQAMYASSHEVTFGCDDVVTKCFQISIPVSFLQPEFPLIPNPNSINWYRNSEATFGLMRVRYGYPSTEGRGYRVCWAPEPNTPFVGQVGEIRVDDPLPMEARLGLTTVLPQDGAGRGAPVIVYFKTGNFQRYEQAEGPMHLFIAFMPGVVDYAAKDYSEVLEPMDWKLNPVDLTDAQDYLTWDSASQIFCGKIFLELWSEDPDGFPMPEGCYYNEDTVQTGRPPIKEFHFKFGRRNHLKANTMYMMVMNMNIKKYTDARRVLSWNFPDTGAVWVWSMDDYYNNPYTVIEMGQASPGIVDKRFPPKTPDGTLLMLGGSQTDVPRFHPTDGFKITAADGTAVPGGLTTVTSYCIAYSQNFPTPRPQAQGGKACLPCVKEEDCGNGNQFTAPDPSVTWCTSPVDLACINSDGASLTDVPAFYFNLRAAPSSQIERTDILRIFLHPLTQWDIQTCIVVWNGEDGCPGTCDDPKCSVEAILGGEPTGVGPDFPVNIMKIDMPGTMGGALTGDTIGKIKVGSTNFPPGGFLPTSLSAELQEMSGNAPDYWPFYRADGPPGNRLYKVPRIVAASLVTALGDGNQYPFMQDPGGNYPFNTLYFKLMLGTTVLTKSGESLRLEFVVPPNSGYTCMPPSQLGVKVPPLAFLENTFPNGIGQLYDPVEIFAGTTPFHCRIEVKPDVALYARSSIFFSLRFRNPANALKYDSDINYWTVRLVGALDTWYNTAQMEANLSDQYLKPCQGFFMGIQRKRNLCTTRLQSGYGSRVPVLGKITSFLISPSNFGVSRVNRLSVFFRTQQMVGSLSYIQAEVWVEAPSNFDFGQYCSASHLDDFYYIPEGSGTTRLPTGSVFTCNGEPTMDTERTFNRAKIRTMGRLLGNTLYGFNVEVTNAPQYLRNQQMTVAAYEDPWTVWTYQFTVDAYWGGPAYRNGVDGAFVTAKFNEEAPGYTSWGLYRLNTLPGHFAVSFADLTPTPDGGAPTDITILPIIVQVPMRRAVRVTAPAGYIWDFEQVQFRYKRRATGVLEYLIIDGVDADLPLSGVPARPVSAPLNVLTIDYMQGAWTPGLKYGFAAKIRIPRIPPTGSANQFTIEFGYNEILDENRLEAGVAAIPLVKSLINGGVSYTTSIANRTTTMTFSVRTVSPIPNGGGLLLSGPANFKFEQLCQPKPVDGYADFPPDVTCLFREVEATGVPQVSIYAGDTPIPPALYVFTLQAQNPPQPYLINLGIWKFESFSQMSERIVLDGRTEIPGYPINQRMGGPAEFGVQGGKLKMPPWTYCFRNSDEFAAAENVPKTLCDFENWQFWPSLGGARDDRPNRPSALVIRMVLATTPDNTYDLVVTAPKGYIFDTDCKVMTYPSSTVFDDQATVVNIIQGKALWVTAPETFQRMPVDTADSLGVPRDAILPEWRALNYRSFNQRYNVWPSPSAGTGGAVLLGCKGTDNVARMTLSRGLQAGGKGYVFRLSVLSNPPVTPVPNTFTLEYAGEASEAFAGVEIWAFQNFTVVPTTTAASSKSYSTWNMVTVTFKPVNSVPHGGHIRILAPAEFQVPTNCTVELYTHPDNEFNYSAFGPTDLEYSEFLPGDVPCEGDVTESSRARILFTKNDKRLLSGVIYVLRMSFRNPETTSPYPEIWTLSSYNTLDPVDLLDQAIVEGFTINSAVKAFVYLVPSSYNAHAVQRIDFTMSFPDKIDIGDTVELVAPITFMFSDPGDDQCPQYLFLQGAIRRTIPHCGANMMWWDFQEETIPAGDVIRFMVQVTNPADTPLLNLFELRHVKPGGVRRSSRMITGYDIIPELFNASVAQAIELPLGKCRYDVPLEAINPCNAVGSYGAILMVFTPTRAAQLVQVKADVNGVPLNFLQATFQFPEGTMLIPSARSATGALASLIMYKDISYTLRVDKVLFPLTAGPSSFDLTTYTSTYPPLPTVMPVLPCEAANGVCGAFPPDTARRNELLNLAGFEILGYLSVLGTSRVNPIYFGTLGATITFDIRLTYALLQNDILRIRRADGYKFIDQSLTEILNVQFDLVDHGLDRQRVWSTTYADPEDYYGTFIKEVPMETTMMFSVQADLPTEAFPAPFWVLETYRIWPLLDVDGEVLNSTHPYYPWIGRNKDIIGTNDGAFPDFLLVGPIPFTVSAQLQTPGALTEITFVFNVQQEVAAAVAIQVTIDITGPAGFQFLDRCFRSPINPAFSKCTGYRNTASMATLQPRLKGSGIIVILGAYNPRVTPSPNRWTAQVFTDDPNQYVRWSEELSYQIVGMPVVYKGNNQLGETASGFFTFSPVRNSPSPVIHLIVTPPPLSGFRLFCTGISPLGFLRMPQCQSGGVNEALTLTFDNATLVAGTAYTFGISLYNPGGKPQAASNYWGLSIQDSTFTTFDANLDIPGLDLRSVPIRVYGLGWTSAAPKVMAMVMVQMRVMHEIPPGSLTSFAIRAPNGIMFSEAPGALKVIPFPLPLQSGAEWTIAGDVIYLNLDVLQLIRAGLYNIRFEVINPTVYPHDNTWSLLANKNVEIEFSHVLTGYVQGQVSPYDLSLTGSRATSGHARRTAAGASGLRCFALAALLVGLGLATSPR